MKMIEEKPASWISRVTPISVRRFLAINAHPYDSTGTGTKPSADTICCASGERIQFR